MNHSETFIRIIDGYYHLDFLIDDVVVSVPSQKLIEELVRFPQDIQPYPHPSDPFNVEHYRIRDRDEDLDNQLILQPRSNWIVGRLAEEIHNPSEFERDLFLWCDNHNWDSGIVRYYLTVIKYCQKILPGTSTNPDKNSRLITSLYGLNPTEYADGELTAYDFTELRSNSGEAAYFDKKYLAIESRKRRFSEFKEAIDSLSTLGKLTTFDNTLRIAIQNEANEIGGNHEKRKKQRTKDKAKSSHESALGIESTGLDYRILNQCLFCNRFHLQEPTGVLSRFCERDECKDKNKAWLQSLKTSRKEIDTKTISPSGF